MKIIPNLSIDYHVPQHILFLNWMYWHVFPVLFCRSHSGRWRTTLLQDCLPYFGVWSLPVDAWRRMLFAGETGRGLHVGFRIHETWGQRCLLLMSLFLSLTHFLVVSLCLCLYPSLYFFPSLALNLTMNPSFAVFSFHLSPSLSPRLSLSLLFLCGLAFTISVISLSFAIFSISLCVFPVLSLSSWSYSHSQRKGRYIFNRQNKEQRPEKCSP